MQDDSIFDEPKSGIETDSMNLIEGDHFKAVPIVIQMPTQIYESLRAFCLISGQDMDEYISSQFMLFYTLTTAVRNKYGIKEITTLSEQANILRQMWKASILIHEKECATPNCKREESR